VSCSDFEGFVWGLFGAVLLYPAEFPLLKRLACKTFAVFLLGQAAIGGGRSQAGAGQRSQPSSWQGADRPFQVSESRIL
jgi:hypothetical protein